MLHENSNQKRAGAAILILDKMDCKTKVVVTDRQTERKKRKWSRLVVSDSLWSHGHQAPPFSRQEYWSGLPFPSPGIYRKGLSTIFQLNKDIDNDNMVNPSRRDDSY